MFDHVTITASDRPASRRFYAAVLEALGHRSGHEGEAFYEWEDFSMAQASSERPPTRGLHIAFAARSRDEVDAFWQAGVDAGHPSDGEPGPRPVYSDTYYGGFLLDPDGNSVEAVFHGVDRGGDNYIDHLWVRVGELEASRRFWATVGLPLGIGISRELGDRFHVAGHGRSFALVRGGTPTENVHIAFPVADDAGVHRFHETALAAGYVDNGGPGERPIYHPGYYAAFVLDPDGNNIEAVNHNREESG